MSNAVDILVVGGPDDGLVLCQPRGVPATIVHKGVSYTHEIYDEQYHIARFDPEDDSNVADAITAKGMTPSWDLL
jgi:hypothetical protein